MFNNYNGKYLIVGNKYVGQVISELWNNNGALLKLDNHTDHVDVVLKRNRDLKILEKSITNDNRGYLVVTESNEITEIDNGETVKQALKLMKDMNVGKLSEEINTKFSKFMSDIKVSETNIDSLLLRELDEYKDEENKAYKDYMAEMMQKLMGKEQVMYSVDYNKGENMEDADPEAVKDIKKVILKNLIEQESFDMEYFYELEDSLSYRNLIEDRMDTLSFGTEIINIIMDHVHEFNLNIKSNGKPVTKEGEDTNLFEEYSLFNFLRFQVVGDYIEISDIKKGEREITEELLPDLYYFKDQQYGKEIDYERIISLLSSVNERNIKENNDLVTEMLKILSQEYLISMQPKVNVLIWTIVRLIACWYADDELRREIYKIKILINSFRSRASQEYNKVNGVEPLITINPQYGKSVAYNVLAYLSLYFFKFRTFGCIVNKPTFYKSIDNDSLLYYTNSSTDMKKYIKFLKKNKIAEPIFDSQMTKIDSEKNDIEVNIKKKKKIKIRDNTKISELVETDNITRTEVFE